MKTSGPHLLVVILGCTQLRDDIRKVALLTLGWHIL
jgi:hypothetical protein